MEPLRREGFHRAVVAARKRVWRRMAQGNVVAWDGPLLLEAVTRALEEERDALELEQAVRGLDSYAELALHPVLCRGLQSAGCAVHREQRYPQDRTHRRKSQGRRCDLVLTPPGTLLPLPDAAEAQTELFPGPPRTPL